jgi:hypothetical protein
MKSFKDFRKQETIQGVIADLENLKQHHNFSRGPVSNDLLRMLADELVHVGIEPEDIYASIDAPAERQEEYLLYKSAPGCGMGKGALGDLKKMLG